MYHCPFCGQKISSDAGQCKHCGKPIGKQPPKDDGVKLTNIDTWQNKSVPSWVMYAVIVLSIVCLGMVIFRGCDVERKNPNGGEETARLLADYLVSLD